MQTIGIYKPDNLVAGCMHRATDEVILEKGHVYLVGSVIAKNSSGKYLLVDSQTDNKAIYGVLAHEVDATEEDMPGVVYLSGELNKNALVFGGNDSYEIHIDEARKLGIYFVDSSSPNPL